MTSRKIAFHIVVVLGALLGCAAVAGAQTQTPIYVSALGSNSNSGARNSPVRWIGQAISLVQAGGHVIIIDSGDYDEIAITKSVTIEAARGVTAVIPCLGNSSGIEVFGAQNLTVVLRGLTIATCPGSAANNGIVFSGGVPQTTLVVEDCVINGQFNTGIYSDVANLFVKDTSVMGCNSGMYVLYSYVSSAWNPCLATIEGCRLMGNNNGLTAAYNSHVAVHDTVASNNTGRGMQVLVLSGQVFAELDVEHCVASGNAVGIAGQGPGAGGGYALRVSNNFVSANQTGIYTNGQHTTYTLSNNTVMGNGTDISVQFFYPVPPF